MLVASTREEPLPADTEARLMDFTELVGTAIVTTLVFRTGQPARIDDYGDSSGEFADAGRGWGFRSAVGVPVSVAGRLWGVVTAGYAQKVSPPADTEGRLPASSSWSGPRSPTRRRRRHFPLRDPDPEVEALPADTGA